MTFSVEIVNAAKLTDSGHHVEIHIDKENLHDLVVRLERLGTKTPGEDLHLMSESWGLGDLTEQTHAKGNVITHHLKVVLV